MTDNQLAAYRRSHFGPAFWFLDRPRRQALQAVYAVFRYLDDMVDQPHPEAAVILEQWRRVFDGGELGELGRTDERDLAHLFFAAAQAYGIPLSAMVDFIDQGLMVDLARRWPETPMDLEGYCYGVAGTVGLACLPIFGVPAAEGRAFAIRLGIAVQWVNIIRDVTEDARRDRWYLPREHLDQFGVKRSDLAQPVRTDALFECLRWEAQVARQHFQRAWDLLPAPFKKELVPARIMGQIYQDLLGKIERKKFPGNQVRLNTFERISAVTRAWRAR